MEITKTKLLTLLKECNWVKQVAADKVGVSEALIRRVCRKYNIDTKYESERCLSEVMVNKVKVRKSSLKGKVKVGSFVAVPDLHSYMYSARAFKAILQFIKDFNPEVLIQLGDLLETACLMSKVKMKYPTFDGEDIRELEKDFKVGGDLLSAMGEQVSKNTKKYFLYGNHEFRTVKILKQHPAFKSLICIDDRLDVGDWVKKPYLDPVKLGKLNVFHGEFWNVSHLRKHLQHYQKNLMYGHTHAIGQDTLSSPLREIPTWAGNIGCVCDKLPDYQNQKSNKWEHGFAYGWFDRNKGDFFPYIVRIINYRFIAEGKWYRG